VLLAQFCSKVDVGTGVHLDRIQVDVGRLDVRAGYRLAIIDIGLRAVPAVLRVQAVGQQNDHVGVLVQWVFGLHRAKNSAA
jgi:hypothetical protein